MSRKKGHLLRCPLWMFGEGLSIFEDGAGARGRNEFRVPGQVAALDRRRFGLKGLLPFLQFLRADFEIYGFFRYVYGDDVPFFDQPYGASLSSLR
jgi:hypothetical protein